MYYHDNADRTSPLAEAVVTLGMNPWMLVEPLLIHKEHPAAVARA